MKRLLITILTAISLLTTLAPLQVSAVDVFQPCSAGGSVSNSSVCSDVNNQKKSKKDPIITTLKTAINLIAIAIGAAAVIILVISGLRMVTSSGDAQGAASARHAIIYALAGLVVAAFAEAFVAFVLNKL